MVRVHLSPLRVGNTPRGKAFGNCREAALLHLENRILKDLKYQSKNRYDKTSEEYIERCTEKEKDLEVLAGAGSQAEARVASR